MNSQEEPQLKYSYRFTLAAENTRDSTASELSKADLLDYINELLGIKEKKAEVIKPPE